MNAPSNWYESFFTGVAVDLWTQAVPQLATELEADRIVGLLEEKPGAAILDVPCGDGRLARAVRDRGYRVTGVDLSEEALAFAHRDGAGIAWERRDMRDLPWPQAFDGAYCSGNSFGYLEDAGNEAFLRSVAAALKPGGRFVLETPMVAESALLTVKDRSWWKVGDIYLLAANRFDPASARLETEYTFVRDGCVDVRRGTHRMYTFRQLVDLFRASGFADVVTWTLDQSVPGSAGASGAPLVPYRVGASVLIVVGRVP